MHISKAENTLCTVFSAFLYQINIQKHLYFYAFLFILTIAYSNLQCYTTTIK